MKITGFIFLSILSIAAMSQTQSKSYNALLKTMLSHSVPEITVEEASTKPDAAYIDAREKEEYDVSRIIEAIHVGYDDFDLQSLSNVPKDQELIVYCSVGYRSEKITEKLQEAGYENVSNLYGGIFEWKNQGRPVVDSLGNETENVHAFNRLWGIWLKKGNRVYD